MLKHLALALSLFTANLMSGALAADKFDPDAFEASLKYQQGKISLQHGLATLNLPSNFRYLGPDDAERVLHDAWGNPPSEKTLGMIVPAEGGVLGDESWGVVVTYEEEGHVEDKDADTINYTKLLKQMKEESDEDDAERKKQGYAAMALVGWAEPPSYDKASHKLYWAKEFKPEGASENSLNYNIRVLGRKGVLVLNAVANMSQLNKVRTEMRQVTAFSDFDSGHRYVDFDSKLDKTAGYGLAALVAGGAAAKLGLFGKLFALLLAFKKLLVLGIGAVGVFITKLFRGKGDKVNLDK